MANSINNPVDLTVTWAELSQALLACRDALTDLSLSLHDHLFEFDEVRRMESVKIAHKLEERVKGKIEQS